MQPINQHPGIGNRQIKSFLLSFVILLFISTNSFGKTYTLEHVFVNPTQSDQYNDLHILFDKKVDSIKIRYVLLNPDGTTRQTGTLGVPPEPGGKVAWDITLNETINGRDTVWIEAFRKSKFKIKEYWWTFDGTQASSTIPVIYYTNLKKLVNKGIVVDKSIELVKADIVKGKGEVILEVVGGDKTRVKVRANKAENKKGFQINIDPPNEFIDHVVIFSSGILFYILGGIVGLALLVWIFRKI